MVRGTLMEMPFGPQGGLGKAAPSLPPSPCCPPPCTPPRGTLPARFFSPILSPIKPTTRQAPKPPQLPLSQPTLGDFEVYYDSPLGEGTYGTAYLARERNSKFLVVLKRLKKADLLKRGMLKQLKREIDIQINLRHPNVLRMYSYFSDEQHIWLVLEYAQYGQLYEMLKVMEGQKFPERFAARMIGQLIEGLHYLHSKHVIHRDLKPENLFVDHQGNLKVADFGWSVHTRPGQRRATCCGTLDYQAPEVLSHSSYDMAVDTWGAGVMLFEFLTGDPPFFHDSQKQTKKLIKAARYSIPDHICPGARDLIQRLLVLSPGSRMALSDAIHHPWLQQRATEEESRRIAALATVTISRGEGSVTIDQMMLGEGQGRGGTDDASLIEGTLSPQANDPLFSSPATPTHQPRTPVPNTPKRSSFCSPMGNAEDFEDGMEAEDDVEDGTDSVYSSDSASPSSSTTSTWVDRDMSSP